MSEEHSARPSSSCANIWVKGSKKLKATKKAAKEAEITDRTLRRARQRLGVKVMKSKVTGYWVWSLPAHLAQAE